MRRRGKVPFKLLYAEDDEAQRELILHGLRWSGMLDIQVTQVTYLKDAVAALQAEDFDAVLLDLGLPDTSALEGLETVLRVSPHTPVVVLSGQDDIELAVACVRTGAQDFIPKSGGLSGGWIERTLILALERKRAERMHRKALEQVQDVLEQGGRATVDVALAGQLLEQMDDGLKKAERFLHGRNPSLMGAVRRILEGSGFCAARMALWELASERTPMGKKRKRSISERAIAALKVGSDKVQTSAMARQTLLESASDFDSRVWGRWQNDH